MPDDVDGDVPGDGDVHDLYRAPLDEFVERRNALAKERGDASIRKLRKPTVAAWAVNVAVADHRDLVDELIDAGEAVRTAQRRAMSGGGGTAMREATQRLRDVVGRLTRAALDHLDNPEAHEDDVRATFQAAATDDEAASALRGGRLERPLEATGFGTLAGLSLVPPADGGDDEAQRERERRRARERFEAAERTLERLEGAVEQAEREAESAAADAADHRAAAEAAEARAADARERAEPARQEADEVREELVEARRALDEL